MRGADEQTGALFSYLSPEAMVPKDHSLRAIRPLVNAALARLSPDFARLYAPTGRASIAPEKLLRALLLQAFYSVRSERQLMEQLTYNMLFRHLVAWIGRLASGPGRRHLVAWIRQESSKIRHLWRLTDSEVSSLFSGLAYPCNKVARRRKKLFSSARARLVISKKSFSVNGQGNEAR